MKKVLIISSSLRNNSNSSSLANEFMKGVQEAGHEVKMIQLQDKEIKYCIGCLSCQKTHRCVIRDDMEEINDLIKESDVVAFATPIYFYEVSGQLKTLLDRTNPLFPIEYKFRDVYVLATAADEENEWIKRSLNAIDGWVECFDKAKIKEKIIGVNAGITASDNITNNMETLKKVFETGKLV